MSKFLIVDDESKIRDVVKEYAKVSGFECDEAENGLVAIEMVADNDYDVVVLDIMMPEMDGYTLTAEIRNNPALKDLHIILHTSLSGVFNKALIEKVGANNFIAKFHPDELATAVKAAL